MEWMVEDHRVVLCDEQGAIAAEITFPQISPGVVNIDHTFVDDSLRGQGIAGRLMEKAVEQIRKKGWKAQTGCSYAAAWREKHPEFFELFV